MRSSLSVLAFLVGALACVAAQPKTTQLQPFTSINVCAPFNVLIEPSRTQAYAVVVDADAGVAEAVNATVTNGALTIFVNGGAPNTLTFRAPNATKVAIQLPADKLASVAVSSVPAITVAIAQGFAVPRFTASLDGTSTLSALNIQATDVELANQGTGNLYVAGTISTAAIVSSGTGSTWVSGVTTSSAVDASGISKVYISGAATNQITGQVSGISNVFYDKGVCMIGSEFGNIFGAPCTQAPITTPISLTTPKWSCALTIYGSFGCSSGTTSSTSSIGGGTSFTSSSSSSSGGTSMTSTNNNGVMQTSTSTGNPDGTSSLVTNTGTIQVGVCAITGAGLNMIATS